LLLITTLGSVINSGALQSGILILTLIILVWMSKNLDKKENSFKVMKTGSLFVSGNWFLRFLFPTPLGLAIAELLNGLGAIFLWTPFGAIIYSKGSNSYKLEFFLLRSILMGALSILVIGTFWLIFYLGGSFNYILPVVGTILLLTFSLHYKFRFSIKEIEEGVKKNIN
jgi:hypothetical protein